MLKTKNRTRQRIAKNPIEQMLGIGGGGIAQAADLNEWDELLGLAPEEKEKGELREGQELNLAGLKKGKSKEEKSYREPGINYYREIIQTREVAAGKETREIEFQLQEIMAEIKKLTDSSRELQVQFKETAIEQRAVKPGKYHKNFFEWLLSVVRAARMKVEDSGAWLAAMHSKKKARQYGIMAKKYGTTFTLSNERVVATQAG